MTFTPREFRDALGLFATGVAIITSEVDGVRLGSTVSSFNSVSLSPPLVLFSLARSAYSFASWKKASTFGITVLAEGQSHLATRFARAGEDKWRDTAPVRGITGVPLLPGLATFECEAYAHYDGGDHDIFVGRVLAIGASESQPLVFFDGRYRRLDQEGTIRTPPEADDWLHGWPKGGRR